MHRTGRQLSQARRRASTCDGRDGRPQGARTRGPRREWRRRGRRRTPPLAAALAREAGIGAAAMAGRAAAGTPRAAERGGQRRRLPAVACLVTSGRWDARPQARVRAMATARPIPRLIERKQPKGGHGGAGTRAGSRYASERWTRGQGSARFRCLMAARATAEIGRAACLKPPPGLSLSKSPFFCA